MRLSSRGLFVVPRAANPVHPCVSSQFASDGFLRFLPLVAFVQLSVLTSVCWEFAAKRERDILISLFAMSQNDLFCAGVSSRWYWFRRVFCGPKQLSWVSLPRVQWGEGTELSLFTPKWIQLHCFSLKTNSTQLLYPPPPGWVCSGVKPTKLCLLG